MNDFNEQDCASISHYITFFTNVSSGHCNEEAED